jgi:hypothetical protein
MANLMFENGFGESSKADLDALRKALSIGYSDPVTGADSLRVESLEGTLRTLSYSATNIKMWNDIVKLEAFSTNEEYNRLNSYGSDAGGFVEAGDTPEEEDSDYSREIQKVKYLGTTRSVKHPATLVRTVPADLIAQETANGVLWMLGKIERGLFYGDSSIIPLEWDGVVKQVMDGSGHIVDLRGAPLTDALIEEGSDLIAQSYGVPSKVYANNRVFSGFSKAYFGLQRWQSPNAPAGMVGTPVKGMSTQAGDVEFSSDIFLKKGGVAPANPNSVKAPNTPTVVIGTPASDANSLFVAADAGSYKYQVTAINAFGESAPSALSAAATIDTGDAVAVTITHVASTYPATGYRIYRTDKSGSNVPELAVTISRAMSGGSYQANTVFTDLNKDLPGMYMCTMHDMTAQSIAFKQLSPLIKMPLAIVSPAISWMQLLYGTPIVYAPKRHVIYKNVGVL